MTGWASAPPSSPTNCLSNIGMRGWAIPRWLACLNLVECVAYIGAQLLSK